jgi:hypothetical protein
VRAVKLAALVLALCAPAAVATAADAPLATVEIRAQGRALQAEYRLPEAVARLPLRRVYSEKLRQEIWRVRTPGVRLEGSVLVGDRPFKRVELTAEAPAGATPKDYPPLLAFSDGGVAVFTGLFDAGADGDRTRYRFVPGRGQRVVLAGRAHERAAEWTSDGRGDGTYAYFGASPLVASGAGLAVLDRALPAWIREEVDAQFPRLVAYYQQRFGMAAPFVPFVLFSYDGAGAGVQSSQGSVLPGVLVMRLEGDRWAQSTEESRHGIRWTLAHEAAHFWNLDNRDAQGAAWMHEGSADTFAHRALVDLGLGDAATARAAFDRALNECLLEIGSDAIAVAEKDGRFGLAYRCGLVLALYTEAAARRRDPSADLYAFWRALLREAGAEGYNQALYVATLAHASGDPRAAAYVARLAGERFDAPAELAAAFARVGAGLVPADASLAAQFARPTYGRLLQHLMSGDCGGGYSISRLDRGLRVHGYDSCKTLKRELDVVAVGPHALFESPREAWDAARARCAAGRPVVLSAAGKGGSVAVPCAAPLPGLPAWLSFQ